MLIYLLKSSGCLLVFTLFYKLLLERESLHHFKRFYLLGSIVLSFGIPLITFTSYVEPLNSQILSGNPMLIHEDLAVEKGFQWEQLLWIIYSLGVCFFTIRFLNNLWQLSKKIKNNQKIQKETHTQVLMREHIIPHTFLNYVFLEKSTLESRTIPSEILLHEEIHVIQKHTLDILFIEFLQTALWFNPIIYLLKKDIKLNHEFLADQAVIKQGYHTKTYQNILLDFSIKSSHDPLVSSINYSLIKKRFTVMKTQTSKKVRWFKTLIILPFLAILIFSFSSYETIYKNPTTSIESNHSARSIEIEVLESGIYMIDGMEASRENFVSVINQLHQDITPEIRKQIINVHINGKKPFADEDVWFIYNAFQSYGYHRIVTYNQEIIREKGNTPFAIEANDQEGASKDQVAEYNKLARKYNEQSKDNQRFLIKDVERLEYLYGLMTKEQKANAQPFPNIPPPPPPPPAPPVDRENMSSELRELESAYSKKAEAYGQAVSNYRKNNKGNAADLKSQYVDMMGYYKKYYAKASQEKTNVVPPPPPPPVPETPEIIEVVESPEIIETPAPPPPPKSAYEFVKSHKNDNYTYYYNDKKVTYNQILDIVKKEPNINISTNIQNGTGIVKFWSVK